MKTCSIRLWLAAWLLGLAPLAAQAEVWGYIDARGVAHFASEQVDERYELFYRGGESFDTPRGAATARAVAVPTTPAKLIAYFEVSPSYKRIKHHLREASSRHGIDYELLQAMIATESGFDAEAVSPKGAVGLMQVMPATAERYGVTADAQLTVSRKLADPRTNIRTGARYLDDLIRMFPGRLDLAVAAYNAGEGAVLRAGRKVPNYRETQNYVQTVLQLYGMLKPPSMIKGGRLPDRARMALPGPAGGAHSTTISIGGARSTTAPIGGAHSTTAPIGGAVGRGNLPAVPAGG